MTLKGNGTGNGLSNIKDTFAEIFQLQIWVLHQSMPIFNASLSGLNDACTKSKEKVPNVSDPNQSFEITCNS